MGYVASRAATAGTALEVTIVGERRACRVLGAPPGRSRGLADARLMTAPGECRHAAAAGRHACARTHPAAAAFITRAIPPYEMLNEEQLAIIELHADQLLEEIGLEIRGDPDAIRLWREAGAAIEDECRVHVPEGLARAIVRRSRASSSPSTRAIPRAASDRRPLTVFAPAYGPPFVSDLERGRRYGTLEDFENFVQARLSLALAASLGRHGVRADGRAGQQAPPRHGVRAHALSDKPFMGSVTTAARAADSIEMCRVLFGASSSIGTA